jgi:hypothetical protein
VGVLAATVIDLVGDVVISLAQSSTAGKIRQGLKERILGYYAEGYPTYVVAHSLGTVYSFDVINHLMQDLDLFNHESRVDWPVIAWATMGSPLGLGMFKITGRDQLTALRRGTKVFPWRNYYDPNDPVVSGSIFGRQLGSAKIAESYLDGGNIQGWLPRDYYINSGKLHLFAHTAYWDVAIIGEGIRSMVAE